MRLAPADRITAIPPYLFVRLEKKASELRKNGVDVISFGIGDPDLPPPQEVIHTLINAVKEEKNHKYSSSEGESCLREAVAGWYKKRFGVDVNPDKNVCVLIGSKEGLANIARGFVNVGDKVLVPDPGYPVYANGAAMLCEGKAVVMPLKEENGFLPMLDRKGLKDARLMYLNYPNNPTGATADRGFLEEAVESCLKDNVLLAYDNAYSEVTFDDHEAMSILELEGAMDCAVEFHSLSKTFNMTGDRLGFAVGNEDAVAVLKKVKSQLDSGPSPFIQRAGVEALALYGGRQKPEFVRRRNEIWSRRLDVLCSGLGKLGYDCRKPKGTFYLFVMVGGSSMEFAEKMLGHGIVVTPGIGFGQHGEGYIRFAVTQTEERIAEALGRMEKAIQ